MKTKCLPPPPLLTIALSILLGSGMANATPFFYDYQASVVPDHPSLQNIFSTFVPSGTSWSATGGVLTLNTAPLKGVWFGNHPTFDLVPWDLADDSLGNFASVSTKLGANSGGWDFYMSNGSYGGSYQFLPGKVQIAGYGDYIIDTTAYHTYAMQLEAGNVLYSIDGSPVYSGNAFSDNQKLLVFGDGSGSGNRGYGSMYINNATIQTELEAQNADPIPEPDTFLLIGLGLFGVFGYHARQLCSSLVRHKPIRATAITCI